MIMSIHDDNTMQMVKMDVRGALCMNGYLFHLLFDSEQLKNGADLFIKEKLNRRSKNELQLLIPLRT